MTRQRRTYYGNLGDASPLEHGGLFVYRQAGSLYMDKVEFMYWLEDEKEQWEVHQISLDRCTFIDGVLSDNPYHPDHPVWFTDKLFNAASCSGISVDQLREALCSDDPLKLASGWGVIYAYFGWNNGDSYPLYLTRGEVSKRYHSFLSPRKARKLSHGS